MKKSKSNSVSRSPMPFTVLDCSREQLIQLKQQYLCQLADDGTYATVMLCDHDEPSWGELADADALVDDVVIFNHYDGVTFTEDDFM